MVLGISLDVARCFSCDYRHARGRFREAAKAADRLVAYANPNRGPDGEELTTDVAWLGPLDAGRVLVLVSATHGVEGFCGSGAQLDFLGLNPRLAEDTAALLIHAINPHGFAWLRRVTEENVDLNRNCIDFDRPPPVNEGYAALANAFVPASLDPEPREEARARRNAWREAHGDTSYEDARSGGQQVDPKGIFYRGSAPTWSLRTIEAICADFRLADRRSVAVIDYHTGLGPYGYGEPICGHRPGESGQSRCRDWYGDSLGEPLLGKSFSLPIAGLTQYAWARLVGADKLTFVALEYGTYDRDFIADAMEAEQWLHSYGHVDWGSEQTQSIKAAFRRAYHPDKDDWKQLVLMRSRQVVGQALSGLSRLS